MNERGFFTVIGICFLLVAAILVKGVQESERNYIYITKNFKDETDLQNIADSALIEAVESIKNNPELVPKRIMVDDRKNYQPVIISRKIGQDKNVIVRAERGLDTLNGDIGNIRHMERKYKSGIPYNDKITDSDRKGVILISVASREIDGNKVYRRALGYFLTDEDADGKIYFMNSL